MPRPSLLFVMVLGVLLAVAAPAAALDSTLTAIRVDPYTSPPTLEDGTVLTGAGVTIAVIDSGVDGTHPMFRNPDGTSAVVRNLETVCPDEVAAVGLPAGCDLVDVPTNDSDTTSASGHGTAVASIAAGRPYTSTSGVVLQGVAPGADVVAISTGHATTGTAAGVALEWVLAHHQDPCGDGTCAPIRVVNASFTTSDYEEYPPDDPVSLLQEQLLAAGVTVVWGTGNSGGDGTSATTNPWGQTPTAGSIMVGAVEDQWDGRRDGPVASFSSRGAVGRPETHPDLVTPGGITSWACRPHLAMCGVDAYGSDPDVGALGGTSASAPYVTGAVALLLQADPSLTPADLELLLEATAFRGGPATTWEDDPSHPGAQTSFDRGHGVPDVAAALRHLELGGETEPGCATPSRDGADDVRRHVPQVGPTVDAPHLDVTTVEAEPRPAQGALALTLRVAGALAGADGSYAVAFDLGAYTTINPVHSVTAQLSAGRAFTAQLTGPQGTTDVPVVVGADDVTFLVPFDLGGVAGEVDLRGGPRVTNVQASTSDSEDRTDRSFGRCAVRVPAPGTVVTAAAAAAPAQRPPTGLATALMWCLLGAMLVLRTGRHRG